MCFSYTGHKRATRYRTAVLKVKRTYLVKRNRFKTFIFTLTALITEKLIGRKNAYNMTTRIIRKTFVSTQFM